MYKMICEQVCPTYDSRADDHRYGARKDGDDHDRNKNCRHNDDWRGSDVVVLSLQVNSPHIVSPEDHRSLVLDGARQVLVSSFFECAALGPVPMLERDFDPSLRRERFYCLPVVHLSGGRRSQQYARQHEWNKVWGFHGIAGASEAGAAVASTLVDRPCEAGLADPSG